MGACRIQHLTSTCEASETANLSGKVSRSLREGLEQLTSSMISDEAFCQATLPVRDGGLGLQDPSNSNAIAHLCSISRLPPCYREHHKEAYLAKRNKAAAPIASQTGSSVEKRVGTHSGR